MKDVYTVCTGYDLHHMCRQVNSLISQGYAPFGPVFQSQNMYHQIVIAIDLETPPTLSPSTSASSPQLPTRPPSPPACNSPVSAPPKDHLSVLPSASAYSAAQPPTFSD